VVLLFSTLSMRGEFLLSPLYQKEYIMDYYLTECCDATTITYIEEHPLPKYEESLQNNYAHVMGMCSECKEWSDCYMDDQEDISDEE
tara:strand:- start:9877 stop:10137 length:261 start_codon:yes stop_codon:yes gene_type:complete